MSEVFFQSIIEKLGAIELLLKVTDTGKEKAPDMTPIKVELEGVRKEIKNIPVLLFRMYRERDTDQKVITNRIEHKHHFHKGIWVSIALFIISILLGYGWLSCHQSSQIFKANDIKYRYLKIRGNQNALNLCKYIDSLYQKDEEKFSAGIELDEQNLIEQANKIRLAGENKKIPKTVKVRTDSKSANRK